MVYGWPRHFKGWPNFRNPQSAAVLRHHVLDPRQPQWRLRLASTRVIARVTGDGLVALEVAPVEIRWKVGAAFHESGRIQMNRAHARATGLGQLAARVAGNLLEVVVGVRDHAAAAA